MKRYEGSVNGHSGIEKEQPFQGIAVMRHG